ncbi:MAG TPA: type VI secretion system tip protein VgrG [Lacibacter sp.]|nr:type VI secretion system tip protein VgrG [Lacibacter sp.]
MNVTSAVIQNEAFKIPSCRLLVYDGEASQSDFPASNADFFNPGKEMEVWAGFNSTEELIFKGIVVKQAVKLRKDTAPMLEILAKDVVINLTTTANSKYFTDKSDKDIIEEIISDAGLSADVGSTGAALKELVQYHSTDWDFIMMRAEANGMICFCENGKLLVQKPNFNADASLDLLFGATLLEMDAEQDARHQFKKLHAQTWNYADQELTEVEATAPELTEQGNISTDDLAAAVKNEKKVMQHGAAVPEQQLQQWADAQFMRSKLSKIRGSAKFRGYAKVKPGQMVSLNGIGDRFTGNAFISGIRHELFGGEWNTVAQFGLDAEPFASKVSTNVLPAAALVPSIKGLHIGIVTDLEDPLNEFRVKIKIPTISMQDEGMWARIMMPDAGDNRGFFFRPEVGDEVVIGFFHDDPNHAVVLGCMHSSAKAAPLQQNNENHEKGLYTRSEMKWVWNDEKKSFTTETPKGKKIVIDEDAGTIELADENSNKIVMKADGIIIEASKAVTIKAGTELKLECMNAELKADVNGKINAGASMELSSGGSTAVKGSVVQIN